MTDKTRRTLREGMLRKLVKSRAKCAMVEQTSASTAGSSGNNTTCSLVVEDGKKDSFGLVSVRCTNNGCRENAMEVGGTTHSRRTR